MTQRALLLVNRHSRQGQTQAQAASAVLEQLGIDVFEVPIQASQHLGDVIRQHCNEVSCVVIGGGDGTLNAAIAALVETRLPLGILPMGTANDLARTLNIPTELNAAAQAIANGKTHAIDLGWVNGQYFFNVASLGLSVQITRNLTKDVKRRWGVMAYAITALDALRRSRPFQAEIKMNGRSETVKTVQIAVGNGRFYGGGMTVAEDAAIDDERLDLYSLNMQHWWQMLTLLPALRTGQHASADWVHAWRGKEFYIYTRSPRSINTDGEITTKTPAHFRILPKGISVFVP
ncbi:MAG TPA: lipid kinase [Stenomitos sp.]